MVEVRSLSAEDLDWKREALVKAWGSTAVARQGHLIDALDLDGFVAVEGGTRAGLLTYAVKGDDVEVVTIHAEAEGQGIGWRPVRGVNRRRA